MSSHSTLSHLAFEVLSDSDRQYWHEHERDIVEQYCRWPDQWFDPRMYERIKPYQLVIDGIQFHYPPISQPQYLNWRMIEDQTGVHLEWMPEKPNENWRFVTRGVTHYLQRIVDDVARGGKADAAKRLGILLHFFQDTHELHALEGPWGTDLFALDRLLAIPDADPHQTPTSLLTRPAATGQNVSIGGYRPRLEGASIAEGVFRLYSRYAQVVQDNRFLHVPIVQARVAGDDLAADRLLRRIDESAAKLSADVIHTVTALTTSSFDDDEAGLLQIVHLDRITPVHRPWHTMGTYTFSEMVPGHCLDADRRRHPLCVKLPDGSTREYQRGWGGGAHVQTNTVYEFPPQVYARLCARIGLHAPLGLAGCVDLSVEQDDHTIFTQRLDARAPTAMIDLPMDGGGEVRFVLREVRPEHGSLDPTANNLAWCDPHLVKA